MSDHRARVRRTAEETDGALCPCLTECGKDGVCVGLEIGISTEFSQPTSSIENGAGSADMWTAVYDGRGTCRMGKDEHDSVVDGNLRVHGIKNLRIADGSVIPVASPYLALPEVLALAERASDIILTEHKEMRPQEWSGIDSSEEVPAPAVQLEAATVTIDSLSKALGTSFSMMQAVGYLSTEAVAAEAAEAEAVEAETAEALMAQPQGEARQQPLAFVGAIFAFMGMGLVVTTRLRSSKTESDGRVALLPA